MKCLGLNLTALIEQLELNHVIEEMAMDLFTGFKEGDAWWKRYPWY